MSYLNKVTFVLCLFLLFVQQGQAVDGTSVFTLRPHDDEAVYFKAANNGKTDISIELQQTINQLKQQQNFGIVFISEGTYKITRTIFIPSSIRLIGYGKKRPMFVLAKNSQGFQEPVPEDKGKARYMFWFTGGVVKNEASVDDANAGTFYSAMSNINLKIEDGNPNAVALRTHYAQHSFVSNLSIYIGKGKAGIFDVGNELENVAFYGGEYGIYTTKCSPGWQMMMTDTYFEGQRKTAIQCQEVGFTIVNMQVKNVPSVVDVNPNYHERLYIENSRFQNVSGPAIVVSNEGNANNQITLKNIYCEKVPTLISYRRSNQKIFRKEAMYHISSFYDGLQMESLSDKPVFHTNYDITSISTMPKPENRVIPALPPMNQWINIKEMGAKGDGVTDDTEAFQKAIEKYPVIYVPQGWYRVTKTVKMKPGTCLIGLHPFGTQLLLSESTPAFSGFGSPQAVLESSVGGKNILYSIGINTGAYNYRAVGCKWMANEHSYLNDVKFVGGHGTLSKGPYKPWEGYGRPSVSSPTHSVTTGGKDVAWDNQYWSLWITNNGGGTFKDIWSANTYATNGVYVSNTSTSGRIYALSVEHHVRNEVRFNKVSNWNVYALQMEEEDRESADCIPLEVESCSNLTFANLYMFRTIRLKTPSPYSVRTWNCENVTFLNVHNYSQIKYTTTLPLYDINSKIEIRPWEFERLIITGKEKESGAPAIVEKLATGFEFAEGMTGDSKGNIYFCEQRTKRIYQWSVVTNSLHLLADFPWQPLSLTCDTKDNLIVVFRYDPQPGYLINGKQESIKELPDANGTSFSGWGNSGFASLAYSINPCNPGESICLLEKKPMGSINPVAKALYPSNRWRDFHDFNEVSVYSPKFCFVAPDEVTIIPECYDLARATDLVTAIPGKPLYASDEYDKRTVKMDVAADGRLSNLSYFAERGEFSSAIDESGNVFIADGQIYVYNPEGKEISTIEVPERPSSIHFGGKDEKTLFVVSRSSLYRIKK